MSTPSIFFDEFAFLKHNEIIYGSAYPAFSQASQEALFSKRPTAISIITTPNNFNLPVSKFTLLIIENACKFSNEMYDMTYDEVKKFIEMNSANDFIFIQFHWHEIGRSKEWYEKQKRGLQGNTLLIKRELDLEWPITSDISPFTEQQLDIVRQHITPVSGTLLINKYYKFYFHKDIDFEKTYMLAVDVAGGLDRDNTAIAFIDPITGEIVGYFKNSVIDSPNLLTLLVTLIQDYFINSFLTIERNSYGLPLIQFLMKSPIASRVYYEVISDETKAKRKVNGRTGSSIRGTKQKTRLYGVNTTKESRKTMVNEILYNIVNGEPELISCEELLTEISKLERTSDTRIEHGSNSHDDLLMAFLVGQYVLRYGNNITQFITKAGFGEDGLITNRKRVKRNLISSLGRLNADSNAIGSQFSEEFYKLDQEARIKEGSKSKIAKNFSKVFKLNN